MKVRLIVITGGIGSGKSIVCRILASMGYDVYDCDSRAKYIMEHSDVILRRLTDSFGTEVVPDGRHIDRKRLGSIVFGNPRKLKLLNGIVHAAVIDDILLHRQELEQVGRHDMMFVETAIPRSSGIEKIADSIWEITAPVETRITRAMLRGEGTSRQSVVERIEAQTNEGFTLFSITERPISGCKSMRSETRRVIVNDDFSPLLPQVLEALSVSRN